VCTKHTVNHKKNRNGLRKDEDQLQSEFMHTDKRNACKISDKKPCIQGCTCQIKRAVEGGNLNATQGIKFYVNWVEMVTQGQIKSTCNKDGEANILSHLPGVFGKKLVRKYQKYLNKTA
jgi:hypothetical protein